MAIRTTLQTKHTVRSVGMIVVCFVLGLWGVYDYLVAIPRQQQAYERGQVCVAVNQALAAVGTAEEVDRIAAAKIAVEASLTALISEDLPEAEDDAERVQNDLERVALSDDSGWLQVLSSFGQALLEAESRPTGAPPSPAFTAAYLASETGINQTAPVTEPGKFDLATQWMFILCLPFVPFMAWQLAKQRRRVVELKDDGTVVADAQTWTRDDIADIDMSRWMARSVAWLVHQDGRRVKLDDYIWKHTDRIVGTLASERYPEAWSQDARPIKPAAEATPVEPEAADAAPATEGASEAATPPADPA